MARLLLKIPVSNTPQKFKIRLLDKDYEFTTHWNYIAEVWTLSIKDVLLDRVIIPYIYIVTGVDLLKPYQYMGIGGQMFAYNEQDETKVPDLNDFGLTTNLYFYTDEQDE